MHDAISRRPCKASVYNRVRRFDIFPLIIEKCRFHLSIRLADVALFSPDVLPDQRLGRPLIAPLPRVSMFLHKGSRVSVDRKNRWQVHLPGFSNRQIHINCSLRFSIYPHLQAMTPVRIRFESLPAFLLPNDPFPALSLSRALSAPPLSAQSLLSARTFWPIHPEYSGIFVFRLPTVPGSTEEVPLPPAPRSQSPLPE